MRLLDLFEARFQEIVHTNPSVATLKALARANRYHSARFVIYKDGTVKAADSEHFTHHSLAPGMEVWAIRGYVTYVGDGEYLYRSMEVYSPQSVDHPIFRVWERAGIENGNPAVVEEMESDDPPLPDHVYHVSRKRNRGSIKKLGLQPKIKEFNYIMRKPGVFCLETLDQARDWAYYYAMDEREPMDIFEIVVRDTADLHPDPAEDMQEHYDSWVIYKTIPTSDLKLVATQNVPEGWGPPEIMSQKMRNLEETPLEEKWTKKYKKSINCNAPKGFSQRAHCAARRKRRAGGTTTSKSVNEANNTTLSSPVRDQLNAWMELDQQYEDPTKRKSLQAKVWPYIQKNLDAIMSDLGPCNDGDYPAAPFAAWLLVQHMDAFPQNQVTFYKQLAKAIPNHPKLQFLWDRAAVNAWIQKHATNPKYYHDGKPLPDPTINVRNPDMFRDAGIQSTSREQALQNAKQAGNKLLVAAVLATDAQTQPSFTQTQEKRECAEASGTTKSKSVSENRLDALVESMLSHLETQGLTEAEAVSQIHERLDEDLRKWFKQKWVRFGPDGKIRGACARGKDSEGKPKCLPQRKAWALGKKKRATAAARKRREDPNPERKGRAKNVATKESIDQQAGIGIDGQTFTFKIRDLVALAKEYPISQIDPAQFKSQLAGRQESPASALARAQKADLQYPIIVVKRKNGQLWIADGTHRVQKALMNNLAKISAQIIPVEDMTPFEKGSQSADRADTKESVGDTTLGANPEREGKAKNVATKESQNFAPEMLAETAQESQDINTLAKFITSNILNKREFDYTLVYKLVPADKWPEVKSPIIQQMLRVLRIRNIKDPIRKSHGTIGRDDDGSLWMYIAPGRDPIATASTVAHELTHALDLIKSQGKAFKSRSHVDKPDSSMWTANDWKNYLGNPMEINARFAQVLMFISDDVIENLHNDPNWSLSREELVNWITKLFEFYKIDRSWFAEGPKGQKSYNRLLSRTMQFYQQLLKIAKRGAVQKPGLLKKISTAVGAQVGKLISTFGLGKKGELDEDFSIDGVSCPACGGPIVAESELLERKDACYYKVKSRYKVWPSAYASGALVQCRKKGAANWGKSKTAEAVRKKMTRDMK